MDKHRFWRVYDKLKKIIEFNWRYFKSVSVNHFLSSWLLLFDRILSKSP